MNRMRTEVGIEMISSYYGSFSLWGHEVINYRGINSIREIDEKYYEFLASDLVYIQRDINLTKEDIVRGPD